MRIGIDCRLAGSSNAGIGRYISQLVTRLVKKGQKQDVTWVLFFRNQSQAQEVVGQNLTDNVKIVITNITHYSALEQILLPFIFVQQKLDLLHTPHFNVPVLYPGRFVITIHDLLWHHHTGSRVTTLPAWQYWVKYVFYRFFTSLAILRAKKIFVPSNTVKSTLLSYYPNVGAKTVVTYEGYDRKVFKQSTKSKRPMARSVANLLYIGSLYPHKNLDVVLRAMVKNKKLKLDVIGARSVFQDQTQQQVQNLGLKDRVSFLGFVDDNQLKNYYQQARALVFPSLSEGFGLPGIEALAVGCPIIVSDIPIFREIYGDAAIYFDPKNSDSFLRALRLMDSSAGAGSRSTTANSIKTYAKETDSLLSKYDWDQMADQTYAGFLSL